MNTKKVFVLTIEGTVWGAKALYDCAKSSYFDENPNASDEEVDEFLLDEEGQIDPCRCLIQLVDKYIDGVSINYSDCVMREIPKND